MKKYNCANFNINNIGEEVILFGWASKIRNLGNLIFIDLRDRSGIIQLNINSDSKVFKTAEKIKSEYVLKAHGVIRERLEKNPNIKTGEIEVEPTKIEILNESKTPVFEINKNDALEETRLKYRYLDLRNDNIKNNLILRHKITMIARNFLSNNDFIEVETPILSKSTPEGARDYLVPSRVNKGKFYALPQSPQIYKQLLMIGGIEKYFQIAKCFRDEDLRADRQPEFTQIDIEMSFIEEEDIMSLTEKLFQKIFKETKGIDIKLPLMRMKYEEAMRRYGSDKPDLRFDMELKDVHDALQTTDFKLFQEQLKNQSNGGRVYALKVENKADYFSRKKIDELTEFVKKYKAKGLAFIKYENNEFNAGISKFLNETDKQNLIKDLNIKNNDIVFFVSDTEKVCQVSLGELRLKLGKELNLINNDEYKFLWITDFPSFEWSEEENRYMACHHPFTAPLDSDIDKLLTDKANCYSKAYDIVCNGYEVGGGSIRIHKKEVQEKMFEALELSKEDIKEKFGFFVNAFDYGTPPHGGLAIGLERLTMLLSKTDNIKDVIAFPKTSSASCLMSDAPSFASEKGLKDLSIDINL